jgi:hypothetical protein
MMEDWSKVKKNDYILVDYNFGKKMLMKAERITKTMIVLSNGTRIRRNNGKIVGADIYDRRRATIAKEEDIVMYIKQRYISYILNFLKSEDAMIVDIDDVKHIYKIISEYNGDKQ